jgi:hypothetical protein
MPISLTEIKSLMVHLLGKAFNPGHLLAYQLEDVGERPNNKTGRGKS